MTRAFTLLLTLMFALWLSGCASAPASQPGAEPMSATSISVNTTPLAGTESDTGSISSGSGQTEILGAWHYLSGETRVMTPDLFVLQFNEDGTAEYMDGWYQSESMEYRSGTYTFDGQIITLSLETTRITKEGEAYGYIPQSYACSLLASSSGDNLVLTLVSGDPLFVYQEFDKPLTFMPWPI